MTVVFKGIREAHDGKHKFTAEFLVNGRIRHTHFGAKGYEDYTIHKDKERMLRYVARHKAHEDWTDPTAAGTLSRFILWNKPSYKTSLIDYKKRFGLS